MRHEFTVPGYETSVPEKQKKAIQDIFKRLFSTNDGKFVLNVLLSDLRYFRSATTDEEKALSEYAKILLRERLGLKDTQSMTNSILETLRTQGD